MTLLRIYFCTLIMKNITELHLCQICPDTISHQTHHIVYLHLSNTYNSILLHSGFHLLHLPRHYPRKNGRVCPLTKQQVFS